MSQKVSVGDRGSSQEGNRGNKISLGMKGDVALWFMKLERDGERNLPENGNWKT